MSHHHSSIQLSIPVLVVGYNHREGVKEWSYDQFVARASVKPLELEAEPTNSHDPNALRVILDGWHVGYLRGTDAAWCTVLRGCGVALSIAADRALHADGYGWPVRLTATVMREWPQWVPERPPMVMWALERDSAEPAAAAAAPADYNPFDD